jgi:hypothetical protein
MPTSLGLDRKVYTKVDTGLDDRGRFSSPKKCTRKPEGKDPEDFIYVNKTTNVQQHGNETKISNLMHMLSEEIG